ncbi:MAG: hypothetical protein ACI9U2_002486 [Bradymonadia bacterium]|jgi:hypothetical protein
MLTTCPRCSRYVQVANVRDTGPFNCQFCPRGAAPLLLYKCTSCMKISPLGAGDSACPRCRTMVRPQARRQLAALAGPRIAPTVPSDWVYHTTNMKVAGFIKRGGLRSKFSRTGNDTADLEGAFARNRDMRLALPVTDKANPVVQQLKVGVAYLRALGLTASAVNDLTLPQQAIQFAPTGGEGDAAGLDVARDGHLKDIASRCGITRPPDVIARAKGFFKIFKSPEVQQQAQRLATQATHCLTAWATSHTALYYRIEEMKTTRNVYVLKHTTAEAGYAAYTKDVSKALIVVLRMKASRITGLAQDISEEKALCTPSDIFATDIEIFSALNPDSFMQSVLRHDASNWVALTRWGG